MLLFTNLKLLPLLQLWVKLWVQVQGQLFNQPTWSIFGGWKPSSQAQLRCACPTPSRILTCSHLITAKEAKPVELSRDTSLFFFHQTVSVLWWFGSHHTWLAIRHMWLAWVMFWVDVPTALWLHWCCTAAVLGLRWRSGCLVPNSTSLYIVQDLKPQNSESPLLLLILWLILIFCFIMVYQIALFWHFQKLTQRSPLVINEAWTLSQLNCQGRITIFCRKHSTCLREKQITINWRGLLILQLSPVHG